MKSIKITGNLKETLRWETEKTNKDFYHYAVFPL